MRLRTVVIQILSSFASQMRRFLFPPLVLLYLLQALTAADAQQMFSGCPTTCGAVDVPYPFAIKEGCSRDKGFLLTCNGTHYDPPRVFSGDFEILGIRLARAEVTVTTPLISYRCFNRSTAFSRNTTFDGNLTGTPFTFSTGNRFTVTGCATVAFMTNSSENGFLGACASICSRRGSSDSDRVCSGDDGCCQTSFRRGHKYFDVKFKTYYNLTGAADANPCSFAFVVEQDKYQFDTSILSATNVSQSKLSKQPVLLDWAIDGGQSCQEARSNSTTYACRSQNSDCLPSPNGLGYVCNCSQGYKGNPYVNNSCIDINECEDPKAYGCFGSCLNTPGAFKCFCPQGTHGDAFRYGCNPNPKSKLLIGIIVGVGVAGGIFLLVTCSFIFYKRSKRIRATRLQKTFYEKNQGILLESLIASHQDTTQRTKIFSLKELVKATNNFDKTYVVGQGGHGTVYKGLLNDQRVVAIKKSKDIIQSEIEQFINEVSILSHIDHRNVVKLHGCCLEAEVPLLVYEFINNGTLSERVHVWKRSSPLPWTDRLRIGTEVAGAISYLHTAASNSIFHRDLKSANILLDDALTAKVSDFGASRSVMTDQTHITTAVQGTYGYLDPEYYHTGKLTDKSDVYSFGVILVELLTGESPVSQVTPQDQRNLTTRFLCAVEENQLGEIIEPSVVSEATEDEIEVVTRLAKSCLKLRGEDRPRMKEVEVTLEGLRKPHGRQSSLLVHPKLTSYEKNMSAKTNDSVEKPLLPSRSFLR